MNEQEILRLLSSVWPIITDTHVIYASGSHGQTYFDKDRLYCDPRDASSIGREVARPFLEDNAQVVVAPAIGGVVLAQWVAQHLSKTGPAVLATYAEKEVLPIPDPEGRGRRCYRETGRFVIKRGYDRLIAGKNVLVVEDVLTTGSSAKKVVEATRRAGGQIVGVSAVLNRGGITAQDLANVPKLLARLNLKFETWSEADCPLCRRGIPINTDVGKGREFLAK